LLERGGGPGELMKVFTLCRGKEKKDGEWRREAENTKETDEVLERNRRPLCFQERRAKKCIRTVLS